MLLIVLACELLQTLLVSDISVKKKDFFPPTSWPCCQRCAVFVSWMASPKLTELQGWSMGSPIQVTPAAHLCGREREVLSSLSCVLLPWHLVRSGSDPLLLLWLQKGKKRLHAPVKAVLSWVFLPLTPCSSSYFFPSSLPGSSPLASSLTLAKL